MSATHFVIFASLSLFIGVNGISDNVTKNYVDWNQCEFPTNTPDRIEWLDLLLVDTQRVFQKYNIPTWIVQSSLLGLVRDGETMPWTWDVDMQLFSNNLSLICNQTSPVRLEMERMGYRIFDCIPNFARVCRVRTTAGKPKYISNGDPVEARLDLYGASLRNDGLYDVRFSPCHWNFTHLFPLREYHWTKKNLTILGPQNYNYWLQFGYGPNWTIPDKYGGGRDDVCTYGDGLQLRGAK